MNGGPERSVRLAPRWNLVPIDAPVLRTLRMRVTHVRHPGQFTIGGIAEVRVPGLRVTESLRMPVDLASATSGADLSRNPVTVLLQRTDGRSGWTTVAQATAGRGGAFAVSWRPSQVGRQTLRAVSPTGSAAARSAASSPTVPLTVYASAIATQFGPGFYNQRTACGMVLTPRTVGVAHTTLPCGTLVEFYYRGRTIRAPVIDRGPYANNATWDLTTGAAVALRFDGFGYVGSLRVGRVSLSRAG